MRLNSDFVPVISKREMDEEATKFLRKYCPEALKDPMPVPVEDIAELKMDLEIDYVNIDKACETLGMMIFSDGAVKLYDQESGQYVLRPYKRGTLLVESDISDVSNRGRERFTITHEIVHWHIHKLRFTMMGLIDESLAKACRCPKEKTYNPKSPEEWMEWQADNLAAAILMPAEMFKRKAMEFKSSFNVGSKINDTMWLGFSPSIINDFIIDGLADTFHVSKQAAEIRIKTLGIELLKT